jgi:hypothetical protein
MDARKTHAGPLTTSVSRASTKPRRAGAAAAWWGIAVILAYTTAVTIKFNLDDAPEGPRTVIAEHAGLGGALMEAGGPQRDTRYSR